MNPSPPDEWRLDPDGKGVIHRSGLRVRLIRHAGTVTAVPVPGTLPSSPADLQQLLAEALLYDPTAGALPVRPPSPLAVQGGAQVASSDPRAVPVPPLVSGRALARQLGRAIMEKRVEAGITRESFAAKLDIGVATLERLEAGRAGEPRLSVALAAASALGIELTIPPVQSSGRLRTRGR